MNSERNQALPEGSIIGGKYRIGRVLGSGGFGITYKAYDEDLKRKVVIKENLPSMFAYRGSEYSVRPKTNTADDINSFSWSMNSFMREAETVAKFDHPAIVKVFDRFQANGTAYFVMPFVEGASLGELVKNGKRFYEEEILSILTSLLGAFTAIHKHQIFHRDVKPDNILITEKGPILIDFGAARERVSEKNLTVIESVGYTPFEQMQTKGNVGPWSDLYGLAAAFYKLLTGEAPPKANDRVRNDPLIPLAQRPELKKRYSTNLLHTLDQCLLFDEYDRPQSAATVQEMLQGGVVTQTATTTATSFTSNTSPQPIQQQEKSKTPLILGTIGGVCILGLLAFIAYLLVGKEPSAPVVVGNNSNPTSAPQEKQNNTQSELERIQAETEAAKLAKARAEQGKEGRMKVIYPGSEGVSFRKTPAGKLWANIFQDVELNSLNISDYCDGVPHQKVEIIGWMAEYNHNTNNRYISIIENKGEVIWSSIYAKDNTIAIREQPLVSQAKMGAVFKGAQLEILDRDKSDLYNWVKVKMVGWMAQSSRRGTQLIGVAGGEAENLRVLDVSRKRKAN